MVQPTRRRGTPPSDRVYHSSPTLQQVQFPSRRSTVRQGRRQERQADPERLKQQTLTQIDFVSSFGEEHDIKANSRALIDAEFGRPNDDRVGGGDGNKENRFPGEGGLGRAGPGEVEGDQEEDDDVDNRKKTPRLNTESKGRGLKSTSDSNEQEALCQIKKPRSVASNVINYKKRPAAGDATGGIVTGNRHKHGNKSRRRTPDSNSVVSGSSYHTQTLTQCLGPARVILDSEDDEDTEFLSWLQGPQNPEHQSRRRRSPPQNSRNSASHLTSPTLAWTEPDEESIVPQTPTKDDTLRVKCGSTKRNSTPLHHFRDEQSLLENASARRPIAIEDSFATESWISDSDQTPTKISPLWGEPKSTLDDATASPLPVDISRPYSFRYARAIGQECECTTETQERQARSSLQDGRGPTRGAGGMHEIPDSDDEEANFSPEHNRNTPSWDNGCWQVGEGDELYLAGEETQGAMKEVLLGIHHTTTATPALSSPAPTSSKQSTPRASLHTICKPNAAAFVDVPRQEVNAEAEPPVTDHRLHAADNTKPLLRSASRPDPIRRPNSPQKMQEQSQSFESQRVPVPILQGLPPASFRTDILLSIPVTMLACLLGGYRIEIHLPFRIPSQVVRFWLLDDSLLRYMACVEPGEPQGAAWRYPVKQMYELNNSVGGDEMRQEGWISGQIQRYSYMPPAVVGQLLWNLRHAIFREDLDGGDVTENNSNNTTLAGRETKIRRQLSSTASPSVSQQVAAQLHSDIVQSTQLSMPADISVHSTPNLGNGRPPCHAPHSPPPHISPLVDTPSRSPSSSLVRYPSASLKASRSSTLIAPFQASTHSQLSVPDTPGSPSRGQRPETSGDSACDGSISTTVASRNLIGAGQSQLLTKSQMLPDSLVRDDARIPPEIWDSEDEDDDVLL